MVRIWWAQQKKQSRKVPNRSRPCFCIPLVEAPFGIPLAKACRSSFSVQQAACPLKNHIRAAVRPYNPAVLLVYRWLDVKLLKRSSLFSEQHVSTRKHTTRRRAHASLLFACTLDAAYIVIRCQTRRAILISRRVLTVLRASRLHPVQYYIQYIVLLFLQESR